MTGCDAFGRASDRGGLRHISTVSTDPAGLGHAHMVRLDRTAPGPSGFNGQGTPLREAGLRCGSGRGLEQPASEQIAQSG